MLSPANRTVSSFKTGVTAMERATLLFLVLVCFMFGTRSSMADAPACLVISHQSGPDYKVRNGCGTRARFLLKTVDVGSPETWTCQIYVADDKETVGTTSGYSTKPIILDACADGSSACDGLLSRKAACQKK